MNGSRDRATFANSNDPESNRNRTLFAVLIAGIFVFALAATGLHYFLKPAIFRIAVGPANSDDHKLIQVMADTFTRDRSPVRLKVVVTPGAPESVALFANREVDAAVARGDLSMPRDAELIAIVRKNYVVLWSATGTSKKDRQRTVKSLDGLEGHAVGIVGRTPSNPALLRTILTASGVDPEKVRIKQFATKELEEMASDDSLSAYMSVGPISSGITSSAITATARKRGQPRFLPIDASESIAQKNPIYESEEIPGSSFNAKPPWPDDKFETVSVSHLIVARKSLPEAAVASLTRQIFTNRQAFSIELPSATLLKKPDTDKDAALPVHRGAAAYVDNNERSFLDGYSDYIWFAVLGLSGIGSAFAWLRKFMAREEWEGTSALCQKIAASTDSARQAASLRELDVLEHEIDKLIAETMHCYDDDLLEEQDLTMINLMFDRFHHVVATRRATIDQGPDNEARLRAV